jgi:outer membrane biosynthesis protein TonB
MAGTGKKFDSLRFNRFDNERLILALLLSLAVHLAGFGGYELGKAAQLFQRRKTAEKIKIQPAQPVVQDSDPVEFAFSDQPSPDAPKNPKYFSDKNSRAANPDTSQDTGKPKINGKQTDMPGIKDEDLSRQHDSKTQQASKLQPELPSQLALNRGDLKPQNPDESQPHEKQEPIRPRTLNQARAMQSSQMPSAKMQQDGGVQRRAQASFDTKALPSGKYAQEFINAVSQHWLDLLDSQQFALDRSGRVKLQFKLNYDGSISDMEIVENTVGYMYGYVCEKAVFDNEPYGKWPSDMRHEVGNSLDVVYTFDY